MRYSVKFAKSLFDRCLGRRGSQCRPDSQETAADARPPFAPLGCPFKFALDPHLGTVDSPSAASKGCWSCLLRLHGRAREDRNRGLHYYLPYHFGIPSIASRDGEGFLISRVSDVAAWGSSSPFSNRDGRWCPLSAPHGGRSILGLRRAPSALKPTLQGFISNTSRVSDYYRPR